MKRVITHWLQIIIHRLAMHDTNAFSGGGGLIGPVLWSGRRRGL